MPQITFHANVLPEQGNPEGSVLINHSAGSGLGFYGNGFRVSVPVNSQQEQTYVTNDVGTAAGTQLHNTAMVDEGTDSVAGTVSIDGGSAIPLNELPNFLCPLNVRFTTGDTTPVKVQNCKLRIFDRTNIDNHAEEVTTYVYEARHPSNLQSINNLTWRAYDESNKWYEFAPDQAMSDMDLTSSPGNGGTNSDSADSGQTSKGATTFLGSQHPDTQHDWYLALSSMPEKIGSKKNYGLYFTLEYLE